MTFTLTGTIADHAGKALAGTRLIITPTPSTTVDTDGLTIHIGGTEVTTGEGGAFEVDLVTAPGLTYMVRSTAGGPVRPVRFAAPEDGDVLDLSTVTPMPAPSPMTEYVKGDKGDKGDPGAYALTPTPTPGVLKIGAPA